MRETQHKEIDGNIYECTMMPIRKAHHTFIDLITTLGKPIVSAIAGAADDSEDAGKAIAGAAAAALMNVSGATADRLIADLFDGVKCKGVGELIAWDPKFNNLFHGRLLSLYKVWAWSLQVNFSDFLSVGQSLGLGTLAKQIGGGMFQNLQTPTEESGA